MKNIIPYEPYIVRQLSFLNKECFKYIIKDKNNSIPVFSLEVKFNDFSLQKLIESLCHDSNLAILYINNDNLFLNTLAKLKVKQKKSIELYFDTLESISKKFL